jgi:hypothetical protein
MQPKMFLVLKNSARVSSNLMVESLEDILIKVSVNVDSPAYTPKCYVSVEDLKPSVNHVLVKTILLDETLITHGLRTRITEFLASYSQMFCIS